nr:hypothetical protein [Tanacetum cinerariifolium]
THVRGVRIGKGTALAASEVIAQHTSVPLPPGSQILKKADYQKVVEREDERVLAAQRKAQAAKDKAASKISAAGGAPRQTKRKKTTPMSFALSNSEPDDSTRSGSGTYHYASPLTTIILNDIEPASIGSNLSLEFANRPKVDTWNNFNNARNDAEVNSPHSSSSLHSEHSLQSQHSAHSDEDTHTRSGEDGLYHDERGEHARRHAFDSTSCVPSSSSGGSPIRFLLNGTLVADLSSSPVAAFDALLTKSYPYVEKIAESSRLPLGDLQNMWLEGEGHTVGSSATNAQ